MNKHHLVNNVSVLGRELHLEVDGRKQAIQLDRVSTSLSEASAEELACFEVSPGGYGIHWPLLDEDLSIDGLLTSNHSRQQSA